MTPDTVPELILWLGATGSASLLFGALVIGPAIYRRRLRRLTLLIRERQAETVLPELAELVRLARDPDPQGGALVRTFPATGLPLEEVEAKPDGTWYTLEAP
jgi:hypothetical protein